MCTMNALKMGIMTTVGAAALTAGAIAGAVIVGGMGMAAASTALIVASVALGVFTVWAGASLGLGLCCGVFSNKKNKESLKKPCNFFLVMASLVKDILCCCCN